METINDYLDRMEEQLSKIEELLEDSRAVPFSSGKIAVDKNMIYDIIDEIRPIMEDINKNIPNEIKQARRIVADSDKILSESRSKAAMVVKNAEMESAKLLDEHEIIKKANVQAMQIVDESKRSARELRKNAIEYADEILAKTEEITREVIENLANQFSATHESLSETVDIIFENRKELRGIKG